MILVTYPKKFEIWHFRTWNDIVISSRVSLTLSSNLEAYVCVTWDRLYFWNWIKNTINYKSNIKCKYVYVLLSNIGIKSKYIYSFSMCILGTILMLWQENLLYFSITMLVALLYLTPCLTYRFNNEKFIFGKLHFLQM